MKFKLWVRTCFDSVMSAISCDLSICCQPETPLFSPIASQSLFLCSFLDNYQSILTKLVCETSSALLFPAISWINELLMQIEFWIFPSHPLFENRKKQKSHTISFLLTTVWSLAVDSQLRNGVCTLQKSSVWRVRRESAKDSPPPRAVPLLLRRPRLLAICHCVYTHEPDNCNLRNISCRTRLLCSGL